jgi:hypothetical protein
MCAMRLDPKINVAKDRIVTNLGEVHSDIRMMGLEPHQRADE